MQLVYADPDFYCGDPHIPPEESVAGLVSKAYAKPRFAQMSQDRNDAAGKARRLFYAFQGGTNPSRSCARRRRPRVRAPAARAGRPAAARLTTPNSTKPSRRGTMNIQAVDKDGWLVSITPSGGCLPEGIARRTGIGLSQWMQSFVTGAEDGPTTWWSRESPAPTPTLALEGCEPWMAFSVQGSDTQDQDLLQSFLAMVELARSTSGPITAIWLDRKHRSMWGAASTFGEDYGIAW